jgi:threonine dehydratase
MGDERTPAIRADDPGQPPLVTLASIEMAAGGLPERFKNTPAIRWEGETWLKLENVQSAGSFKIRGAWTKLSRLSAEDRARGVIAYSSGNHGIAVAHAARLCGAGATVVVPGNAPGPKTRAIRLEGAELVTCGEGSGERRLMAEAIARDTGRVLIPPYDDADVIAGQGTIGLELLSQVRQVSSVVVPIGGGGLISGIAAAIKAVRPAVRVIGVEPELAADAREALASRHPVEWPAEKVCQTIADGVRTQSLGSLNFAHVISLVDEIVTVSDEDILDAAAALSASRRLIVEPAGAVAAAAVRNGSVGGTGAVVVLSGGNVGVDVLRRMLRRREDIEASALLEDGQDGQDARLEEQDGHAATQQPIATSSPHQ